MSSMIIPIGFGSGGASGGRSYIQIYADAPQYIEGKYLRVSLGGDEIYADSIPTNVDAITLQITEAGTYTIGLYASSSASTATESHTVLVDNLNASPSVHFGERIYKDENAGTITYYTQSDTSIKSSSTLSGTSETSATSWSKATIVYDETWTAVRSGFIRFKFSGNLKGSYSGTANADTYAVARFLSSNGTVIAILQKIINANASVAQAFSYSDDKIYVEAGETYTIKVGLYVQGASGHTATLSNGSVKVCGSSTTYTLKNTGIISKAIKSLQFGTSTGGGENIMISAVNPNNSTLEWVGGTVKRPETPTQFKASVGGVWKLTEYY